MAARDATHMCGSANVEQWSVVCARTQGAEAPSIFLFNLGPLSPIVIFHMHQANPQNLYIDVDGVLDALLSGRQRHEPAHYTGAGPRACADFRGSFVVAESTRPSLPICCAPPEWCGADVGIQWSE